MTKLAPCKVKITAIIFLLLAGFVATALIPKLNQPAYAHTFTGDESASFLSVIRILLAENNLVQTNLASNPTLAQEHAKAVVNIVNGNHTFGILPDEVSENNKRVASDVIRGANALQTTVSSKPAPTPADVGAKINYLNGVLQEAVTVRVPKAHTINSTIIAQATKNIVNETLRQYGYAFGVANAKGGGQRTITNMSAYQSAQGLASQTHGMLIQAKSVISANATSATKPAVAKLDVDLSQLKKTIDEKNPYDKVASLVQKTVYPDIDTAFHMK